MKEQHANRPYTAVAILALAMLAAVALSVAFVDRVAGQPASTEASAPVAERFSQVPTMLTAEEVQALVREDAQWSSTPIGETGCRVNSGNPHRPTKSDSNYVKTVGGVVKCNSKKDRLWSKSYLYKKDPDSGSYYLEAANTIGSCYDCYRRVSPAKRYCWNDNRNTYFARADATVANNGKTTRQRGESQIVTINCGGF